MIWALLIWLTWISIYFSEVALAKCCLTLEHLNFEMLWQLREVCPHVYTRRAASEILAAHRTLIALILAQGNGYGLGRNIFRKFLPGVSRGQAEFFDRNDTLFSIKACNGVVAFGGASHYGSRFAIFKAVIFNGYRSAGVIPAGAARIVDLHCRNSVHQPSGVNAR